MNCIVTCRFSHVPSRNHQRNTIYKQFSPNNTLSRCARNSSSKNSATFSIVAQSIVDRNKLTKDEIEHFMEICEESNSMICTYLWLDLQNTIENFNKEQENIEDLIDDVPKNMIDEICEEDPYALECRIYDI